MEHCSVENHPLTIRSLSPSISAVNKYWGNWTLILPLSIVAVVYEGHKDFGT